MESKERKVEAKHDSGVWWGICFQDGERLGDLKRSCERTGLPVQGLRLEWGFTDGFGMGAMGDRYDVVGLALSEI